MALTKVTGPLVSGSTNNLGDYTINNITGVAATFSGNLSVGGTITYQDVTSIDSVGIITAQAGIHLGIGATTGKIDVATGISTFTKVGIGTDTPSSILESRGTAATYTNAITVFTGNTTNAISGGKNGIGLYSYGDALRGGLSSNLLYSNSSTPSQSHTGRSSGEIEFVNTTTADKTSAITFGGYVKGSTTFVERIRIDNDGKVGINTTNPDHNLHVYQNAGDAVVTIESTGNNNHAALEFYRTASAGDHKGAGSIYVTGDTSTNTATMNFGVASNISHGVYPRLSIFGDGNVGIGSTIPTEKLDVLGNLVVAEEIAVNRPRIVLSAPNDGTNYKHLFGANLQVDSSGTFTTPTANISGGGWEYLAVNSLNAHGHLRYLSAPDTNATTSTPVERFRIESNGYVGINTNSSLRAPLHVAHADGGFDATPYNKAAIFGSKGWVTDTRYHYTDATIFISGRNNAGIDTGAGIEFTTRTVADNNWRHGAITFGQDGIFRVLNGGAGTTEGTEKVSILTDGKVGIGSTTPTLGLDINKGANSGVFLGNPTHGYQLRANVTSSHDYGLMIEDEDGNDLYRAVASTGSSNANTHTWWTAGEERLRIDSSGNVGIGTDNPTQELTIHGSTFTSLLIKSDRTSSTDQIGGVSFMNQAVGVTTATINALVNGTMLFKTAGSEALRIDSSGNVGVNNTNPAAYGKFVVTGTSNVISLNASSGAGSLSFFENGTGRFYLKTLNGSTGLSFVDGDNSTERLGITSEGEVNIGTGVVNIAKFCQSGNHHQIVGQAADDVAALDVYSQHGNDGDRISFAVSDNRTGSKSNSFVVRGDGRVGINATSPSTHLQIGDGTTDSDNVITLGKRVSSSESNLPLIGHHSNNGASSSLALCATSSSGKIHFFTGNGGNGFGANSNAERMLITSGGAVGIATDKFYDSSTRLEVRGRINTVGSASTGSINPGNGTVVNVGSLTNHNVQLMTGNSTRVTIVQAGTSGEAMRISGVGVTVQSSLTPNFEVRTTAGSGQDCKITLKGARTSSSTSSIAMIRFVNATSSSYTMGEIVGMDPAGAHASQIGDLVFRTTHNDTTTEVARFTGGATAAGRNLKFADGSGIDFSATTNSPGANSDTTNEVLNDYERGTFDFKLDDANSGSDTLKMHYVKVGSIVHCYGPFRGSEGSNASVYWQLSSTGDSNITTSCELPFVPVDSGACDSPIYRNIETREPKNPSDGELMPVLGWAAGDSTCRLTDTRTEKVYNAFTAGDTMQKADTRTNVVLHFNFCYVTNS